ncbi:hypothetical protein I9W82_000726 [Candida metapsilosis]|uniref:Ubiquitin-conjugating enzyme E2C-binding protein n=1 Tax=Candida metapsilosis TaxID=273372 RepID=A0A8H7ZJV1_9ASCO|nr:hypothetical protein I9W82_000726 [Candida metapsilosis]
MYSVEYLPRLNQLSIEIENVTSETITGLKLEEGRFISISIKGLDEIRITCPILIKASSPTSIKFQKSKLLISLKVEPEANSEVGDVATNGSDMWSCGWLNKHTSKAGSKNEFQFRCSKCQNQLIDSLDFIFKDMPGDYWYELMDFWHCHKPANNQPTDKDYGILKPKNDKTIVIGSCYLLQTVNSCLELIEESSEAFYACKSCHQIIGDKFQDVIRLLKWKLSLTYTKNNQTLVSTYDPLLYAVNLFNTKIQSSALRKFAIESNRQKLCLWILNTDIDVTINGQILFKCMKVWWYSVHDNDTIDSSYEQTEIPYKEVVDQLLMALQNNTINSNVQIGSIVYQISYIPTSMSK